MTTANTTLPANSSLGANLSFGQNFTLGGNYSDYYFEGYCATIFCIVQRYRNSVHEYLVTLSSLLGIIGLIGVIGNSIVIGVFVRKTSKHTSMYFMLMLAIMDLMVCSLVIPEVLIIQWRVEVKYDAVCKIFEMLRYFSIPTSAMILVAIACDRYILICTPPSVRMSQLVSKIVIGVILAIGVMFSIPPILGISVYATGDYGDLFYIGYCVASDRYITIQGLDIYWYVITAVFGLMILVIFTMYTLIFITLYKQNNKWQMRTAKVHPERLQSIESNSNSMLGERHKSINSLGADRKRNSNTTNSESLGTPKEVISMFALKQLVPNLPDTIFEDNVQTSPFQPIPHISFDDQRCIMKKKLSARSHSEYFEVPKKIIPNKRSSLDVNQLWRAQESKPKIRPEPSQSFIQRTVNTATYMSRRISDSSQDYRLKSTKPANGLKSDSKWRTLKASVLTFQKSKMSGNAVRRVTAFVSPKRNGLFQASQKSKRPMHIKTTQVLFIVTLVYIASFLPTFLMSNNVIPNHKILYYMYFINNAANPIIYSFMNQRFRKEVAKLFCGT